MFRLLSKILIFVFIVIFAVVFTKQDAKQLGKELNEMWESRKLFWHVVTEVILNHLFCLFFLIFFVFLSLFAGRAGARGSYLLQKMVRNLRTSWAVRWKQQCDSFFWNASKRCYHQTGDTERILRLLVTETSLCLDSLFADFGFELRFCRLKLGPFFLKVGKRGEYVRQCTEYLLSSCG